MLSFGALATKVFGSANERKVKKYTSSVDAINALEPEVAALTDEQLRALSTFSSSAAWCCTRAASPR
jgi:preprotein translocase subunit SecA